VKVQLRNPTREIEMRGPVSVNTLLARLELNRESFLVIRGDELIAGDAMLDDDDYIEVRPVISGGTTAHPGLPEGGQQG
jgi:sulfur carrier protein